MADFAPVDEGAEGNAATATHQPGAPARIASLDWMRVLYFAYGSNLKTERMRERVPSAEVVGPACLHGFRITCDKQGADGSGKANLRHDAWSFVWGAVYAFDPSHWSALDACETRYERVPVRVAAGDEQLDVETYRSQVLTDDPVPFDWYRRLILEGAREHRLPDAYLRALETLPFRRTGP
jgi:gamma-glutamylcyclotransferase (GGCT)/AIG2-like uncharacterized protein YtfP